MPGFVKLLRDYKDHEAFQDETLWRIFTWCLMSANYMPSTYQGISLSVGQFVLGRVSASQLLKIPEATFDRKLKRLETVGLIERKPNSKCTVVTVLDLLTCGNQEISGDTAFDTAFDTTVDTANGQPVIQQMDTDKEGKNLRREESKKDPVEEPTKPKAGKKPKDVFDPMKMIPSKLDTEEFREAWGHWIAHRAEIKKPLTPTAARMNIQKCLAIGIDRSLAAFAHSIGSGWQGLFEESQAKTVANGANNAADPRGNLAAAERFKDKMRQNGHSPGPDIIEGEIVNHD